MRTWLKWLQRQLKRPLLAALLITVGLLCMAILTGFLLGSFGKQASLSIDARTESVLLENICVDSTLDLLLSPGNLRQLSADGDALTQDIAEPTLLRLKGQFKLTARRRLGESLHLVVGPSSEAERAEGSWSARFIGGSMPPDASEQRPLQMRFEATKDEPAATAFTLPLIGRVILGESSSTHYGDVGRSVPRPAYLLHEGRVRVGTAEWWSSRRIEIAEHAVELGDVVDTAPRPESHDVTGSAACAVRQAQGIVRLDPDGALHASVRVDQDSISVVRGRVVQIGTSAVESFTHQPLVALAWQCALIVFLLVGVVQQLFEVVTFYKK